MRITMEPIGTAHTDSESIPRHWTVSDVKGRLVIDSRYILGLKDIRPGTEIVVLFYFHKSRGFSPEFLVQTPPHRKQPMGVFSICSPIRPNPIGLSVLEVLGVDGGTIHVSGIDMIDGTPILDIKPHIKDRTECPSHENPNG